MTVPAAKQLDETIEHYQALLQLQPQNWELLSKLAATYQAQGRLDEAIAYYQQAIEINSEIAELFFNLGTAYFPKGEFDKVVGCFERAVQLKPNYAAAYCNLGAALYKQGKFDESIAYYQQALAIQPNFAEAYCCLGTSLATQQKFAEAIQNFQTAIRIKADYVDAWCYLGNVHAEVGNLEEAISCYRQALSLQSNHVDSHFYLSNALLARGDWQEGWQEYEWRSQLPGFPRVKWQEPIWNGSDLQGKTIIVHAEQGLGDVLQFVRYLPLLTKRGAKVILSCPSALVRLFSYVPGIHRAIPTDMPLPACDAHIHLLSLPCLFQTTIATVPNQVPYLRAIKDNLNVLTAPPQTKLKVGFVWSSGYRQEINLLRMYQKKSCSINFFLNLHQQYPEISFFSLQLGKEVRELQPHLNDQLQDLSVGISDFADTADLIDQLDLVISVDTAVAHLAGAMGKPVWLLLPFTSDWRWLLERTDTPWYPTMRLFRQAQYGDWESVFAQVKQALEELLVPHYYQKAGEHYQQGNLTEAIALCQKVIALQPQFVSVYASLANMQVQLGQYEEAIVNYQTAISLQPNLLDAYSGLVYVLQQQNRSAEATYWQRKLIELSFQSANQDLSAYLQSGQMARLQTAIAKYEQILKLNPYYTDAAINLAVALRRDNRLDAAIACLQQAIKLQPYSIEAYYNLGNALTAKGDLEAAIACYQQGLSITPYAPICYNLAILHEKQERWTEAIALYRQAIELNPSNAAYYCNLGNALMQDKQLESAISTFQQALAINPNYVEVLSNLGLVYTQVGKIEEAIASCRQALAINPNFAPAHCNMGFAFMQRDKMPEAERELQRAIELYPNYALAKYNLSHVWLKLGDYERGWNLYENRWDVEEFENLNFLQPLWRGEDLQGKTILLFAEQGYGDVLQFVRYAELVTERSGAAKVILQCEPPLVTLLQNSPYIHQVVDMENEALPEFDVYAPLMSLPYLFGTTLANIPAKLPYLFPPATMPPHLQLPENKSKQLKVGIVWSSGYRQKLAPYWIYLQKSCPLNFFLRLLDISGLALYSLQVGKDRESLSASGASHRIHDIGIKVKDFAETSAAIAQLDLVIAVDTSVAHLAGGMGKPVWLLLHSSADWRWLMNRQDTPWYPKMRLFQQSQPGDWESVFAELIPALEHLVASSQ